MLAWVMLCFHLLLVAHLLQVSCSRGLQREGGSCTMNINVNGYFIWKILHGLARVQAKSCLYLVHQDECLIRGAENVQQQDRSTLYYAKHVH